MKQKYALLKYPNQQRGGEVFSGTALLVFTGDMPEPCVGFVLAMQVGFGVGGAKKVTGAAHRQACELIFQEKRS